MKTVLAATLALGIAAPAAAAPRPKTNTGAWTMSGVTDGAPSCALTFVGKADGGKVETSAACVQAFPRLRDATAWAIMGGGKTISLLNPARQRIYRFERTGDGAFATAANRAGDIFLLTKGPPAKALSARERMSGAWSVTGAGGKPRCAYVSKSNAAGTKGTLTLGAEPHLPEGLESSRMGRVDADGR